MKTIKPPYQMTDAEVARFARHVLVTETCWLWTASRSWHGYGQFHAANGTSYSHRLAYERLVGDVPAGLVLDHLCRTKHCVNPTHLEPVTNTENLLRGNVIEAARRRALEITECPQGHPYAGENLIITPQGRMCRTCRRERNRLRNRTPDRREQTRAWGALKAECPACGAPVSRTNLARHGRQACPESVQVAS